MCSCSVGRIAFPAAESGRTSNSLEPLGKVMSTLTNGAGVLAVTFQMLEIVRCLKAGVLAGVC